MYFGVAARELYCHCSLNPFVRAPQAVKSWLYSNGGSSGNIWIGLNDNDAEGQMAWHGDTQWNYFNGPNGFNDPSVNCVVLGGGTQWEMRDCNGNNEVLCRRVLGSCGDVDWVEATASVPHTASTAKVRVRVTRDRHGGDDGGAGLFVRSVGLSARAVAGPLAAQPPMRHPIAANQTDIIPANPATPSGSVYGLTAETDYCAAVSVQTSGGSAAPGHDGWATLSTTAVTAPGAPQNVRLRSATGGAVVLEWEPPVDTGGETPSSYFVELAGRGASAGTWESVGDDLPGTADSHFVGGLSANSPYTFRVTAINSAGVGVPSVETTVSTGELSEPGLPTDLSVVEATGGSLLLQWSHPADTGGIALARTTVFVDAEAGIDVAYPTASIYLTGLDPNTAYSIALSAANIADSCVDEVVTDAVDHSTTDVTTPSEPRTFAVDSVSGGAISVTWEAPEDDGGADIDGYVVRMRVAGEAEWADVYDDAALEFTAYALTANTEYDLSVSAYNSAGEGASVELTATTTESTPPSAPLYPSVAASSVTGGSLRLHFAEPLDAGGAVVQGYVVVRRLCSSGGAFGNPVNCAATAGGQDSDGEDAGLDGDGCTLYGLLAETCYELVARAANVKGTGPISATVSQTTASLSVPSVPDSVSLLTVDPCGGDRADSAPCNPTGGAITLQVRRA